MAIPEAQPLPVKLSAVLSVGRGSHQALRGICAFSFPVFATLISVKRSDPEGARGTRAAVHEQGVKPSPLGWQRSDVWLSTRPWSPSPALSFPTKLEAHRKEGST